MQIPLVSAIASQDCDWVTSSLIRYADPSYLISRTGWEWEWGWSKKQTQTIAAISMCAQSTVSMNPQVSASLQFFPKQVNTLGGYNVISIYLSSKTNYPMRKHSLIFLDKSKSHSQLKWKELKSRFPWYANTLPAGRESGTKNSKSWITDDFMYT